MLTRAFDINGNRIPFAIYDSDFCIEITERDDAIIEEIDKTIINERNYIQESNTNSFGCNDSYHTGKIRGLELAKLNILSLYKKE